MHIDLHGWSGASASLVWGALRDADLVRAFGLDMHMIKRECDMPKREHCLETVCWAAGIRIVTAELTPQKMLCEASVAAGARGVLNVMKQIGMLDGEPERPPQQIELDDGEAEPHTEYALKAEFAGLLVPRVRVPALVKAGEAYEANHSLYGCYDRFWEKNTNNPAVFEAEHKDWFAKGYDKGEPPQMCFTSDGLVKQRVAVFEKAYWDYMVEGRQQYVTLTTAPIPSVKVPRVAAAGGDVAKVDWSKGAPLEGWYNRGGDTPAQRKLSGRAVNDGEYFYLELTDPCDPRKLHTSSQVWPYDDWEIFLAQHRDPPFRQIGISPSGNIAALTHGEENWRINVPWLEHGIKTQSDTSAPDKWVTRIAIPLRDLAKGGVPPGGTFYMNVVRTSGPDVHKVAPGDRWGLESRVSYTSVHEAIRLAEMTLEL